MAEIFSSPLSKVKATVPAPIITGEFIASMDIVPGVDARGIVIPWGGTGLLKYYQMKDPASYGVSSMEMSFGDVTSSFSLDTLVGMGDIYNHYFNPETTIIFPPGTGVPGPQGPPGADGADGVCDLSSIETWVTWFVSQYSVRMARTTEAATAAANLTCNLYDEDGNEITSGYGSGIEVYCKTNGGGNLNVSVPLLKDNQDICVIYTQNKWWCTELFNTGQTAIAFVKTTPGAVTSVVCWFSESDGTGQEITVPCDISGGGDLNSVIRRLVDGDKLQVARNGATWRCTEGFQTSEDCICYSAP